MNLAKKLYPHLPHFQTSPVLQPVLHIVRAAQRTVWWTLDISDKALGRRDPLTPPRRLMYVGTRSFLTRSDFNAIGQELLTYLVDKGGLKSTDDVLDVGCGVGRMAAQLAGFLSPGSTYHGFDIVREGVEWCSRNISARHPNFHFHHSDIFNTRYNPAGTVRPDQYRFPFEDGQFSFIFLTSVFTHMLGSEMRNYLSEIARVMAPGGRCLITYFLLNEESERRVKDGTSLLDFRFPVEHGKVVNEKTPEIAVAFEEDYVRHLYRDCGIQIREPIHYGSWSGHGSDVGYQDIIVGTRPRSPAPD